MQRHLVNGKCEPVYPHQYLRTNTIFEIIKNAGGLTAWSDKHPAYEVLSGPSGKGIDDLFTPEINSQLPARRRAMTTPPAIPAFGPTTPSR